MAYLALKAQERYFLADKETEGYWKFQYGILPCMNVSYSFTFSDVQLNGFWRNLVHR